MNEQGKTTAELLEEAERMVARLTRQLDECSQKLADSKRLLEARSKDHLSYMASLIHPVRPFKKGKKP